MVFVGKKNAQDSILKGDVFLPQYVGEAIALGTAKTR